MKNFSILEKDLQNQLEKHELTEFVTTSKIKKWIYTDENYGEIELFGLLAGCMKEPTLEAVNELGETLKAFTNACPRAYLEGNSPGQLKPSGVLHVIERVIASQEWTKYYNEGVTEQINGNLKKCLNCFISAFKKLLEDHTTGREIYRLYANTAAAYFGLNEHKEGETFLEMALKLNPNYEFAHQLKAQKKNGVFLKQPNFLSEEDQNQIKNEWTVEYALEYLANVGITFNKEKFIALAHKTLSSSKVEDELFYPFWNKEGPEELLWVTCKIIWKNWCPKIWDLEIFLEAMGFDDEDEVDLHLVNKYALNAPKEIFTRWQNFSEAFVQGYYFRRSSFDLLTNNSTSDAEKKEALAANQALHEKSGCPYFDLVPILTQWTDKTKGLAEIDAITKHCNYDPQFYLEAAEFFEEKKQAELAKKCYQLATEALEKRVELKETDYKWRDNSVYEDYRLALDALLRLSKKDDAQQEKWRKYRKAINEKKKELSITKRREAEKERFDDLMEKEALTEQERLAENPGVKYFNYLQSMPISFKTSSLIKGNLMISKIGERGEKIKTGRNDPCFCNSGKKFKKCCGAS